MIAAIKGIIKINPMATIIAKLFIIILFIMIVYNSEHKAKGTKNIADDIHKVNNAFLEK